MRACTNRLLAIRDDGYRLLLGYLVMVTRLCGSGHYGMPRWPAIAASARELFRTPGHPAWHAQVRDTVLAVALPGTPLPDALHRALLDGPDTLPLAVLDWLAGRVLYPARLLAADRVTGSKGPREAGTRQSFPASRTRAWPS